MFGSRSEYGGTVVSLRLLGWPVYTALCQTTNKKYRKIDYEFVFNDMTLHDVHDHVSQVSCMTSWEGQWSGFLLHS